MEILCNDWKRFQVHFNRAPSHIIPMSIYLFRSAVGGTKFTRKLIEDSNLWCNIQPSWDSHYWGYCSNVDDSLQLFITVNANVLQDEHRIVVKSDCAIFILLSTEALLTNNIPPLKRAPNFDGHWKQRILFVFRPINDAPTAEQFGRKVFAQCSQYCLVHAAACINFS